MKRYRPTASKLVFRGNKRYHVFLSFRGSDVRNTLVDHLFIALSRAGLNVFLDSVELEKGDKIWKSLKKAIRNSAILIPIFSKGYADSAWCLREAAAMLRTSGLIVPLFYHMTPTNVRYPENDDSPYKKAFSRYYSHSDRYTRQEIYGWNRALRRICKRSGWSVGITQGFEGRLVKEIVNDLTKTFDRKPFEFAGHLVEMEKVNSSLIQKLNLNSVEEVVKVGIWGIGGIGKTTAAKFLFNEIYVDFYAASFVENVSSKGLPKLQKQILKDLINYDGKVHSDGEGIFLFRNRLSGLKQKVLLILDDVDTVEQLKALVGNWLSPGSRVVITSRDKHILNVAGVSSKCIHEMTGLEKNESLELFNWYASPIPGYKDMAEIVVEACGGHPHSLEVMGCFLSDKKDDVWIEAPHNIRLKTEIHNRLFISYKALSDVEKEIFKDISCFFDAEHKDLPIVFWKCLPDMHNMVDTAVNNLVMKALIKIDDEGVFHMHDCLKDMGRDIAEKEEEPKRLWKAACLRTTSNSNNFSHVQLNKSSPQSLEEFYRHHLRFLHLQDRILGPAMAENKLAMLPRSLIWLRVEHCQFPSRMDRAVKKPRCPSVMDSIWQWKIMQLKHCFGLDSIFLSSLFSLPNIQLQYLDLGGCQSLSNLPHTISNLSQLQHLGLRCCENLTSLADTIGKLSQLKHLDLGLCSKLINLPDTISNLSELQSLNLEKCKSLENLPSTIGNLPQLRDLNLKKCKRLNNLPSTIGNLSQLQSLNLEGCLSLESLPNTIGNLSQLQHLYLKRCLRLDKLPNTIGKLSKLQHLDMEEHKLDELS